MHILNELLKSCTSAVSLHQRGRKLHCHSNTGAVQSRTWIVSSLAYVDNPISLGHFRGLTSPGEVSVLENGRVRLGRLRQTR